VFRSLDLRAHAEVCECLHFGIAVCAARARSRGEDFLAKLAAAHIYSDPTPGMNANRSSREAALKSERERTLTVRAKRVEEKVKGG
jgi:hypothetical protein